ncbi:hypothetical protein U0070_016012 [Myodes glareolus]|uniref:Uncharacterized protein n=1 Tax=Myodes glareolus TaxID=447135 RepID=A0AAW0GXY9_MYOGA
MSIPPQSKKVSLTIAEIILPKTPVKESQSEHIDRAVDRALTEHHSIVHQHSGKKNNVTVALVPCKLENSSDQCFCHSLSSML